MTRSVVSLDYEGYSEAPLSGASSVGVWNYTRDITSETLMVAYEIDDGGVKHVDLTQEEFPKQLRECLLDPHVEKWAFNAGFERLVTKNTLQIDTPYEGWRCTMALANLQSFSGTLLQIGEAIGIEASKLKNKAGDDLIKMFCMPLKLTKKNSYDRRTRKTNPVEWEQFCEYNIRDVIAEKEIKAKLLRYYVPEDEWELYEIDQRINDRGLPVNRRFVQNGHVLSERRKRELTTILRGLTGIENPNSTSQLLPWLREHGYPFTDLQKNTVRKVLDENKDTKCLDFDGVRALKLRQQASKTSVKKYPAILRRLAPDDRLRHCFQFAGAARTARWAGRGPQPHNLTRTPKLLEADGGDAYALEEVARAIEEGDYDTLRLLMGEPMNALSGSIRSSFQAEEGHEFTVCDLSAIESAVSAWLTGCKRLLGVFRDKRDPYLDFGTELYHKAYAEITKSERTICKPAVLGCTYQLGGGELRDGKRTGLWGYAENMGVNITNEEANRQVALFRSVYHEIPAGWKAYERAVVSAMNGRPVTVNGLLHFELKGPYMTITLPSGRPMYYFKPRMVERTFEGRDGPYTRTVFSYMGMSQTSRQWGRVFSSGGKIMENVTQATARDILKVGIMRAEGEGFHIVGTVHDEIITQIQKGSNLLTLDLLRDCMKSPIPWAKGLPLGAAGYTSRIYRKD